MFPSATLTSLTPRAEMQSGKGSASSGCHSISVTGMGCRRAVDLVAQRVFGNLRVDQPDRVTMA